MKLLKWFLPCLCVRTLVISEFFRLCVRSSVFSGIITYGIGRLLPCHIYLIMLIQILLYPSVYLLLAKLLKMEELAIYTGIITKSFHRK